MRKDSLEARGGIEPPMKVLQTFALPLGNRAMLKVYIEPIGKSLATRLVTVGSISFSFPVSIPDDAP
jgi:hypothetical protein